jgi:DNA (cytosine-5)-methyltransferase 1
MATLLSSTAGISRVGNAVTEHETYIPMAIPIHDQATRFAGKRGDKQDGKGNGFGVGALGDPAPTLTKGDKHAVARSVFYVGGIDFENNAHTMEEPTGPLLKGSPTGGGHPLPAIAFAQNQLGEVRMGAVTNTLNTNSNASGRNTPMVQSAMQVRRLTPTECERLQGFPDGYTNIPWRKSQESPDGPRYKALGNSMAVPVMRWIGERINKVDNE